MPKMIKCVCGHARNKHHTPKGAQEMGYHRHHSSICNVKDCDCDFWRWDKKEPKTDYEMIDKRLSKCKESIEEYSKLKDNWDGYGANKLSKKIIEQAKANLILIDKFFSTKKFSMIIPSLAPVSDGSIQFEWNEADWYLEIEFQKNGKCEILMDHQDKDKIETYKESSFANSLKYLEKFCNIIKKENDKNEN